MPLDQANVCPLMVVSLVGAAEVNKGAPSNVDADRSERISLASRNAPSILISPAPCSKVFDPGSGWAVNIRIALIRLGVRLGFTCNRSAAAPAAIGADMEDPLRYIIRSASLAPAFASSSGCAASR